MYAETLNKCPPQAGTSEADQLKRIFKTLGSPTQQAYPALVELPDYTNELDAMGYPPPSSLTDVTPHIDHAGINLLSQMLTYDPLQRCSAADAMKHEYFKTHHAG